MLDVNDLKLRVVRSSDESHLAWNTINSGANIADTASGSMNPDFDAIVDDFSENIAAFAALET